MMALMGNVTMRPHADAKSDLKGSDVCVPV